MFNINPARHDNQRNGGSATAWALVWLAGISGVVAFSVDRYVPMIEAKLSEDVRSTLSIAEQSPIQVVVQGHQAILSGPVIDDQQRRALIDSAMATPGIFSVADELKMKNDASSTDDSSSLAAQSEAPEPGQSPDQNKPMVASADADLNADADLSADADVTADDTADAALALLSGEDAPVSSETDTANADPELILQIRDGVMTINGRMATSDAIEPLLQVARNSLEVNSISNSVVSDDDIASAEWMKPILSLLPALSLLEQAGLEIAGDQIVLSGIAADEDTYDAVVNEALQTLTAFSLVEDIDIADAAELQAQTELAAQARATRDAQAETEAAAQAQRELDAKAEADRTAQAKIEAQARAERVALETAELEARMEAERDAQAEAERKAEAEAERQAQALETAAEQARVDAKAQAKRESEAQAELDAQTALEREAQQDTDSDSAQASSTELQPAETDNNNAVARVARSDPEPVDSNSSSLEDRRLALTEAMNNVESTRVLFRSGQDVLTARSAAVLDGIAGILRRYPDVPMGIDGHTDAAGDPTQNLLLSQRRANVVRDYLVESGISAIRLSARGFGEELPLVSNSTRRGRAANRRIEFNY